MTEFHVTTGAFSGEILVGSVDEDGVSFKEKEPMTDHVIGVVASYVLEQFDGSMLAEFPEFDVQITVTRKDTQ